LALQNPSQIQIDRAPAFGLPRVHVQPHLGAGGEEQEVEPQLVDRAEHMLRRQRAQEERGVQVGSERAQTGRAQQHAGADLTDDARQTQPYRQEAEHMRRREQQHHSEQELGAVADRKAHRSRRMPCMRPPDFNDNGHVMKARLNP
jgi:hypothetical protein